MTMPQEFISKIIDKPCIVSCRNPFKIITEWININSYFEIVSLYTHCMISNRYLKHILV